MLAEHIIEDLLIGIISCENNRIKSFEIKYIFKLPFQEIFLFAVKHTDI